MHALHHTETGQSLTELVISMPIILAVIGVILQLGLDYNARNLTQYAAFQATRAAIVQIPATLGAEEPYQVPLGGAKWTNIRKSAVLVLSPVARSNSSSSASAYAMSAEPALVNLSMLGIDPNPYLQRYEDADKHITITFETWGSQGWEAMSTRNGSYQFAGGTEDIALKLSYEHYETFPVFRLFWWLRNMNKSGRVLFSSRVTLPLEGETVRLR